MTPAPYDLDRSTVTYSDQSIDGDITITITAREALTAAISSAPPMCYYTNEEDAVSDFCVVHWAKLHPVFKSVLPPLYQ